MNIVYFYVVFYVIFNELLILYIYCFCYFLLSKIHQTTAKKKIITRKEKERKKEKKLNQINSLLQEMMKEILYHGYIWVFDVIEVH